MGKKKRQESTWDTKAILQQLPQFLKWETVIVDDQTVWAKTGSPEGFDIVIQTEKRRLPEEGREIVVSWASIGHARRVIRYTDVHEGENSPGQAWEEVRSYLDQMAQDITNLLRGSQDVK